MRAHPGVFHHALYAFARGAMVKKIGRTVEEYLKEQQNEFPQSFCEFVTLGNVAMHLFPDRYELVEQVSDLPTPDNKLQQFWSHGSIGEPQDIWVEGKQMRVVPIEFIKALGLHHPPRWIPTPEDMARMLET